MNGSIFWRILVFCLSLFAGLSVSLVAQETEEDSSLPSSGADPSTRQIVNQMPQAALQEAFRLLRSEYIRRDTFTYEELNRAALEGLLSRMEFGAMLLTEDQRASQNSPYPFFAQKINANIGYVRFGRFEADEVEKLDAALEEFEKAKIEHLILDLRSPQSKSDLETAAQLLGRFCDSGELLFKIQRPGDDRPRLFLADDHAKWDRPLLVLIDAETGTAGETMGAVLKLKTDALLIGQPTMGLTVEYRDVPLGDGRILRYAVAEVILPDETPIFGHGLTPDLPAPTPTKQKRRIFAATKTEDLKEFLFDHQRPRLNEAALVAGIDPELDFYLAEKTGKTSRYDDPPLQDRALQQAVDLIETAEFFSLDHPAAAIEEPEPPKKPKEEEAAPAPGLKELKPAPKKETPESPEKEEAPDKAPKDAEKPGSEPSSESE